MRKYLGPVLFLIAAALVAAGVLALLGRGGGPVAPGPVESMSHRPLLHACLNGLASALLVSGFVFVRNGRVRAHVTCMLLATATSLVFLGSYLQYHYVAGSMPFRGEGWTRPVYFGILLTHTVLAAVVPPLAAVLLFLAARRRFERHKRIARWALPMWIYVSTTGVLIYLMLYVWFNPR